MEEKFYDCPTQVIFRAKKDDHKYAGIAYGNVVISAKSGIVIPLYDIEYLKEEYWLDLTDAIKGDLTEVD